MAQINPYVMFNGKAEEALNFYKSVFGGEFVTIVRYRDMPGDPNNPVSQSDANKIMHIALPIGESDVLMASDIPEKNMTQQTQTGNKFYISIGAGSKEEADKLFNGLSAGGQIEVPIADSPWGSYFGMFADKYGIQWMVDFDARRKG